MLSGCDRWPERVRFRLQSAAHVGAVRGRLEARVGTSMFGKRAADLIREIASCTPDTMPPYNDESVRKVLEEVSEHDALMNKLFNDTRILQEEQQRAAGEEVSSSVDWDNFPQQATAALTHHAAILRNKRLLLTYQKERLDHLKALRWRQRGLPESIQQNLSPLEIQWFKRYDQLLTKYFRADTGVGLDLTLGEAPPKPGAPSQMYRVLEDYGEVAFSIGSIHLKRGTTHLLPCSEAEPLVREDVLVAAKQATHWDRNI